VSLDKTRERGTSIGATDAGSGGALSTLPTTAVTLTKSVDAEVGQAVIGHGLAGTVPAHVPCWTGSKVPATVSDMVTVNESAGSGDSKATVSSPGPVGLTATFTGYAGGSAPASSAARPVRPPRRAELWRQPDRSACQDSP
jgi:hypothetical protein